MPIHAILFKKNIPKTTQKEYLKKHDMKYIRNETSEMYNRYTLDNPNYKKYIYRVKPITKGIKLILEINKK